jgi:hypothetical protein
MASPHFLYQVMWGLVLNLEDGMKRHKVHVLCGHKGWKPYIPFTLIATNNAHFAQEDLKKKNLGFIKFSFLLALDSSYSSIC